MNMHHTPKEPHTPTNLCVTLDVLELTPEIESFYNTHLCNLFPKEELLAIMIFIEYFSTPEDRSSLKVDYINNLIFRYIQTTQPQPPLSKEERRGLFDMILRHYEALARIYQTSPSIVEMFKNITSYYYTYYPQVTVNKDKSITLLFTWGDIRD